MTLKDLKIKKHQVDQVQKFPVAKAYFRVISIDFFTNFHTVVVNKKPWKLRDM